SGSTSGLQTAGSTSLQVCSQDSEVVNSPILRSTAGRLDVSIATWQLGGHWGGGETLRSDTPTNGDRSYGHLRGDRSQWTGRCEPGAAPGAVAPACDY